MIPTVAHALGSCLAKRVDERLNEALVGDFRRQGAIAIRQLLTPGESATLREDIEANLAQPSSRAKIASKPDDSGRFFEVFCNWQHDNSNQRFIFEAPSAIRGAE